ncbi:MAG: polyprenyl synthetase family protein, partial [Proteobacteria bacterium]|nr:polyprenyl synthetase family protein [Pseudomonadota bacterium]
VDNADLRRVQESANAVWGNEASVLVGDFLFSKSFSLLVADGDLGILRAMSDATTLMAEGEVLELLKTSDMETLEQEYLEVVTNKTAVLLAAACEIGGLLGRAPDDRVAALRDYGMEVGIAFQLMDDCLDYVGDQSAFGKEVGTDLAEGKITLPLIHALRQCTPEERGFVQAVLDKDTVPPADLEGVLRLIQAYGGIAFTRAQAERRVGVAKERLSCFPPCPERAALETVAEYVVTRNR